MKGSANPSQAKSPDKSPDKATPLEELAQPERAPASTSFSINQPLRPDKNLRGYSPGQILALQRLIGNKSVQQMIARSRQTGTARPLPTFGYSVLQRKGSEGESQENTSGLPDGLKSHIEALSGLSLDSVKVHYNSPLPAQQNALAFTQGSDIQIAPGQEKQLPHEAWHVVQQAQGRVQPTTQLKGSTPVNDDEGLEHEADVMGSKALAETTRDTETSQEQVSEATEDPQQSELKPQLAPITRSMAIIQRVKKLDGKELEVEPIEDWVPVALDAVLPPAAQVWKLKGYDGEWLEDKLFYTEDSESEKLVSILPKTINEYWDEKYAGFERVSGPDWRKNCADHAIGQTFEDVGAAKDFLKGSWTNKGNYNSVESLNEVLKQLEAGIYVAQVGLGSPHFIRLTITAESVAMSQKDGESGVYEASMGKEAAAEYIWGKSGSGIIYMKV